MLFEDYYLKIENDIHYNSFKKIYDVFSNVIDMDSNDLILNSIDYLRESNIVSKIKHLQSISRRTKLPMLVSATTSLLVNLNGLISMQTMRKNELIIKSRKVLLSFINFEYATIEYNKIISYLELTEEQKIEGNHKLVLAIGTTDLGESIKVNEEIKVIYDLSKNTNYHVISLMECTIDAFKTYLSIYKFDYIHIAGHGMPNGNICFYKSNAKPITIEKYIISNNQLLELFFVNCCYSKEFYNKLSDRSFSDKYITYKVSLVARRTLNFSEVYYSYKFIHNYSISDSFSSAEGNIHDSNYELL